MPAPPKELPRARLFIVDDEESICQVYEDILGRDGHEILTFTDGRAALEEFRRKPADIILQDLKMPGMGGLELLQEVKSIDPRVICIVFTAHDLWDAAVEAMRLGAYNYIKKPVDNDSLRSMILRALELKRLGAEGAPELELVIGNSPGMLQIESLIHRVAPTDSTILISGEHGTGKERLARAIHHLSLRRSAPFVPLNCGGLTETLLESELFGHAPGAFTGAAGERHGYFETASGGTLFMDEVGEMPPTTQVKVLRVLEDRIVTPVGMSEGRLINVRIVAATNRDLEEEVAVGRFRADLLYRLNVIPVRIPPLRERREDIPTLAGHFLRDFANRINKPAHIFSGEAIAYLLEQPWPGNIRQLRNTIERAVALAEGEEVTLENVRGTMGSQARGAPRRALLSELPDEGFDLEEEIERIEKQYLVLALERFDWNQTHAAEFLQMSARSFRYKMKKLGVKRGPPVA